MADLEPLYLEARYSCTALWAKARSRCPGEAAAVKEGIDALCGELRRLLRSKGSERVAAAFDKRLLEEPLDSLLASCRGAAERLREAGSAAASRMLEALGRLEACLG